MHRTCNQPLTCIELQIVPYPCSPLLGQAQYTDVLAAVCGLRLLSTCFLITAIQMYCASCRGILIAK